MNPHVLNGLGQPVAYKLVPTMSTPTLLAQPDSSVGKRAGFAQHNLWATPYAPDERRAAGEHPNQHEGGDGLPRWSEQDRNLVDTDVVLWYTFGVTHFVRPEDWPVMPVEYAGFTLMPFGFFDRNPALDVSPTANGNNCLVNLTGIPNAQYDTVTLTGALDDQGNAGNVSTTFGVLLGDTTEDGAVNSGDIAQIKSQSGQPVTSSNFREDPTVDGNINSGDIALVKSKSGTALPP